MLVRSFPGDQRTSDAVADSEFISLADIIAFLRRYAVSILAFMVAGICLAAFMVVSTDRIYSAGAQILIEPKLPQYLQQSGGVSTALDTAQIESQIAVMRSEKIAQMVIGELSLMDHPDFFILGDITIRERLHRVGRVVARAAGYDDADQPWFVSLFAESATSEGPDDGLTEFERSRLAIDRFGSNIDIRRVGVSYAVAIAFRSRNAELSAEVANATANSFVREQMETKAAAARQGGEWLEQRMGEMRAKMNTATQIAQEFRSRHDYRVRAPGARLVNGEIVEDDDGGARDDAPTLEELEVTADTYRQMYESFLLAFTNNLSQQSYPVADARVITVATRPLAPSYPRKKLVLAFGILAGLMAGVGVAFARHMLDSTIRSPRHVQDLLGIRCLGQLPARRGRNGGFGASDEVAALPRSTFSESLKRAKFEIRLAGDSRHLQSIGITSALPGEGKAVVASNLALLYSLSGRRTLLIDADAEFSDLSREVLRSRTGGQTRAVTRACGDIVARALREVDLMPSAAFGGRDDWGLPNWSAYDIAVVNLPPLASGPESLALGAQLGCVLVVTEWGRTSVEAVDELVSVIRSHNAPILGMLLTKSRSMPTRRYRRNRAHAPHQPRVA